MHTTKAALDFWDWIAACIIASYPQHLRLDAARAADEYLNWLDSLPTI